MNELESHQLIPSGSWDGFYLYGSGGGTEHPMPSQLQFAKGVITGGGSDDVGAFSWRGTYDLGSMTCSLTKSYASHNVAYHGQIDENGIWGTWTLYSSRGGFHLWPAKPARSEEEVVEEKLEIGRPHGS